MPARGIIAVAVLFLGACGQQSLAPREGADEQGHTDATAATARANARVASRLPLDDPQDFEDAQRGLLARAESLVVKRADGTVVWDQDAYAFVKGEAPATANPSLWRQTRLNNLHGLFEVVPGIYQVRGYDLANMSLIRGETGWIVVDPLTVGETAEVAMQFAMQHLEKRPISAVIFTHSHIDHFGGIQGLYRVTTRTPGFEVIAPEGFLEEAVSENVMAGVAMQRRAGYMYGRDLARSPRGHIDTGLGKEPPRAGAFSIARPDRVIDRTGERVKIDGVEFVFQNAPGSEAPAELTFYLPQHKAFCGAEVVSRNIHNVYTLRGAKVRDALAWSEYIQEALDLFGDEAEVYFGSHQWPMWGKARLQAFMKQQRDVYKYIHDQTLRMANLGYTPREIAEKLKMPASLEQSFANRGYYGTVKHNAKAVYQRYFGWYDGNPANLDPLPPSQAGRRYVDLLGGAANVLSKAQEAFDDGDYRWVAELLSHLVFADPGNAGARALLAETYDQLGYQAESGPWRDVYLSAAYELRHGTTRRSLYMGDARDLLREIPRRKFFDSMAARLNGPRAEGQQITVKFHFSDLNETYLLDIENAVMHHRKVARDTPADASLSLTHELFLDMVIGDIGLRETILSDDLDVSGNRLDLIKFFRLFDKPDGRFAIVTPD